MKMCISVICNCKARAISCSGTHINVPSAACIVTSASVTPCKEISRQCTQRLQTAAAPPRQRVGAPALVWTTQLASGQWTRVGYAIGGEKHLPSHASQRGPHPLPSESSQDVHASAARVSLTLRATSRAAHSRLARARHASAEQRRSPQISPTRSARRLLWGVSASFSRQSESSVSTRTPT